MELFGHQKEAVDFLVSKNNALLADCPGAGKTPVTVVALQRVKAERILIVCPASLKANWARELTRWQGLTPFKPIWFSTGEKLKRWLGSYAHIDCAIIVNYEQLGIVAEKLQHSGYRFDAIVFDEAHYLKSLKARRTKIALGPIWEMSNRHWLLTGTPLPNGRAVEAFPTFSKLAPDLFSNWKKYAARYCIEEQAPWHPYLKLYRRSKNLDELGRLARENFMLRRSAKEVLQFLPPLQRQVVPLTIDSAEVRKLAQKSEEYIQEALSKIDAGEMVFSDSLSTARRLLGAAKVPAAIQYIYDLLDDSEEQQVVVFAHHKEVIEGLGKHLTTAGIDYVKLIGASNAIERQKAVDDFQDKKAKVFLGSILAANTGITLTAADCCVIVEADWVPSNNEQAEGRIYRIGQEHISRIMYLTVPNSLDSRVVETLISKSKNIQRIYNE